MRILLSNDDGIAAPGLELLVAAASLVSDDIWVVAPEKKHTAAGSSLTIGQTLSMQKRGERRYSCSGRPADCMVAAFAWLFAADTKPDLVLAGINDGRNVAEDLAYSGTLGIAREATFWGVPAIGFSRVREQKRTAADKDWLAHLIEGLWVARGEWAREGHWLSINLPSTLPASFRQPRIGRDKIARHVQVMESGDDRTDIVVLRGRDHATSPGDENSAIDAGFATVSRLNWYGETRLDERVVQAIHQC